MLNRGKLKLAQQICDKFGVLASSVSGVDMEVKTEASIRHARTLIMAKQFSQVDTLRIYFVISDMGVPLYYKFFCISLVQSLSNEVC